MPEVIGGLARAEAAREGTDAAAQTPDGSLGKLAQKRLELAERYLDRIEIRRVWGQIAEPGAARLDGFAHAGDLVRRQIIHGHDVFALEGGS